MDSNLDEIREEAEKYLGWLKQQEEKTQQKTAVGYQVKEAEAALERAKVTKTNIKISMTSLWVQSVILSSQSWEIGSPPGGAGRMKQSCVVPTSVIHIWPIHISWGKILHLCVSTVSVFWQFATFWWSAIILLEKGKIYLVEEMWWNHLDSTPH